jgi:hypothetical protein
MTPMASTGRLLIVAGIVLVTLGVVLLAAGRLPRLPGDVVIQRPAVTVYFPIGTMILVSLVLTLIFNVLLRR